MTLFDRGGRGGAGHLRLPLFATSHLIPALTIPVSIIGAFMLLAALGFSINLLTLLALILAIGLVVDDAIVVLENAQRRVDHGEPPLVAAYRGTRQVTFAVLATSAVLVAVYCPPVAVGRRDRQTVPGIQIGAGGGGWRFPPSWRCR